MTGFRSGTNLSCSRRCALLAIIAEGSRFAGPLGDAVGTINRLRWVQATAGGAGG